MPTTAIKTPPKTQLQALISIVEDGTLEAIANPYFDSSRCAYLASYESAAVESSQNLTLVDMGGVFLILGLFAAASLVTWIFHGSPPANWVWRRFFPAGKREAIQRASEVRLILHVLYHRLIMSCLKGEGGGGGVR